MESRTSQITLQEFLSKNPRPLISFRSNDILADAIVKLQSSNISSAPVLGDDNSVLGFVDALDMLAFLIIVNSRLLYETKAGESRNLKQDEMNLTLRRQKDYKITHIQDVIDSSQRNPFIRLTGNSSLQAAAELFAKGIHRIAVSSEDGKQFLGIISQSDLLSFSLEDINKRPELKDLRIGQAKNLNIKLHGVLPTVQTIDALLSMHKDGLSSYAIVDGFDLLGVLSASDIKHASLADNFSKLLMPVYDFIKDLHKESGKTEDYLVAVTPDIKLSDAIKTMIKERVHRIFVTKPPRIPYAVMSLTDIIREIYTPGQAQAAKDTKAQTEQTYQETTAQAAH
jgi:CBS domain-containing protein